MNKYTLRFDNKMMEDLYFQDQFKELLCFYKWACYLGTISAVFVFSLEFIVPFGFDNWRYTLILIPIGFASSFKFIKMFPQYFNLILASMNLSLGGLIFILLFYFSSSNILFLAGQTVAMIQYSLLLGSNIIINISTLLLNQLGLMIMGTIIQNYFNSLQVMFILALILVLKSIWSSEKMKRQFFLLKHQNIQLHRHLDSVFQLKIVRCKFEKESLKLTLLSKNKQAERIVQDQISFTNFIRDYAQVNIKSQSTHGQTHSPKKTTLEQFLFKIMENNERERTAQIYSEQHKSAYKISIYKVIDNGEVNMILLLQEDAEYDKLKKLNQQLKKRNVTQKLLFTCLENVKQSLQIIRYLIYKNDGKPKNLSNSWKLKEVAQQPQISNIKLLELCQKVLFKSIHGYYNCLIYNNEFSTFDKITKFNKNQLLENLNEIKSFLEQQQKINIDFESNDFVCESNYALILQLILNIILEQLSYWECKSIIITMSQKQIQKVKVIHTKIMFYQNFTTKNNLKIKETIRLKEINKKILTLVGWNKDIKVSQLDPYDLIEFDLLQSLKEFQQGIQS